MNSMHVENPVRVMVDAKPIVRTAGIVLPISNLSLASVRIA